MILKQFFNPENCHQGDDDPISDPDIATQNQICTTDSQSPKFAEEKLKPHSFNYHLRTMGNTEDETVLNGSPHIQYYANDTFNGNEHFQTEVLNNKENIAPIAISRKNSQKNHSPNSHLTFSVSSKYVFNSISKMGSPVAFDVWSKRRTKQKIDEEIKEVIPEPKKKQLTQANVCIVLILSLSFQKSEVYERLAQIKKRCQHEKQNSFHEQKKQTTQTNKSRSRSYWTNKINKQLLDAITNSNLKLESPLSLQQADFFQIMKQLGYVKNLDEWPLIAGVWFQLLPSGDQDQKNVQLEQLASIIQSLNKLNYAPNLNVKKDVLFCNRLSNEQLKTSRKASLSPSFKPEIQKNSKKLADQYRNKLQIAGRSSNTQDLYNASKEKKMAQKIQQQSQKEMKECTFQPKINRKRGNEGRMSLHLTKTRTNKDTEQVEWERQQHECTFQPKTSKMQRKCSLNKVDQKSVERMKKGESIKELKRMSEYRNYPKNENFNKKLQELKKKAFKTEIQSEQSESQKIPLLFVDISLGDRNERIVIYQGDKSEEVAQNFCKKHGKIIQIMNKNQVWMRIQRVNSNRRQSSRQMSCFRKFNQMNEYYNIMNLIDQLFGSKKRKEREQSDEKEYTDIKDIQQMIKYTLRRQGLGYEQDQRKEKKQQGFVKNISRKQLVKKQEGDQDDQLIESKQKVQQKDKEEKGIEGKKIKKIKIKERKKQREYRII